MKLLNRMRGINIPFKDKLNPVNTLVIKWFIYLNLAIYGLVSIVTLDFILWFELLLNSISARIITLFIYFIYFMLMGSAYHEAKYERHVNPGNPFRNLVDK